ncbi:MAG: response regulator transcription factor [Myxococcales bacterium]|nr:response regulator transcription factor [Myxococcales bacterium]
MSNSKSSVIILDDHVVFREGLRALIECQGDFDVVGEAGDGQQGVSLVRLLAPDVAVVDLNMPRAGGIEVIARIRGAGLATRALVLSVYDDDQTLRAAMEAGASGYVQKKASAKQMIEALRRVAAGSTYLPGVEPDPSEVNPEDARRGAKISGFKGLTERELAVLVQLAWGHTHPEIADTLRLSVKTVDTYRQRITRKLGLRTRAEVVRFAMEARLLGMSEAGRSGEDDVGRPWP